MVRSFTFSASEVTTLWRYTNLFIVIIINSLWLDRVGQGRLFNCSHGDTRKNQSQRRDYFSCACAPSVLDSSATTDCNRRTFSRACRCINRDG